MILEELIRSFGNVEKTFVCKTNEFTLYIIRNKNLKSGGCYGKPLFVRDYGNFAEVVPGFMFTEYYVKYVLKSNN